MTFPFGKNINYGFFQQFDPEMLGNIRNITRQYGIEKHTFFQYRKEGWIISDEQSCSLSDSFNPHTGEGKGTDGAAHSRAICATQFVKNKA